MIALALVAAAVPVAGTHDDSCSPTSGDAEVQAQGLALFTERMTVTVYGTAEETTSAVVVYREANGVPGIQRADAFGQDRACGHGPDALILLAGCTGTAGFEPYDGGLLTPTCDTGA